MKKNIKIWIFCVLMTFVMVASWCFVSTAQASVQQDFINRLSPDVVNIAHKYNLYPSVMMAQAALESSFGQSQLSQEANNYFGVKGDYNGQSVMVPTLEYDQNNQPYYVNSEFRKYPDVKASIEDNAQLIRDGVYGNPTIYSGAWRENATDGITAATALGGKYATDPNYASDLVSLIQQYNLNSLLDNTWKRLHIEKLKKKAATYIQKIKRYRKSIKHLHQKARTNRQNPRVTKYHSELIKYTKLYKNDQVILGQRYREYHVYDHLSKLDLDNWKRLSVSAKHPVYTDLMGTRNGHQYYRIRFSPSQKHMYWVRADALEFAKPTYYYHPYQIDAHEMDLNHSYNHILGTSNSVRLIQSHFRKPVYRSNVFAVVPPTYTGHVWYQIRNDEGRQVWLAANPRHTTQYLKYREPKVMNRNYTQAPLVNHAADSDYHSQSESWSRVRPRQNRVEVDRLAINTRNNDSFWYRINNHHRTEWTNVTAFK